MEQKKKPTSITEESHQALSSVTGALQMESGRPIKLWKVLSDMILAHSVDEWVKLIADKDIVAER